MLDHVISNCPPIFGKRRWSKDRFVSLVIGYPHTLNMPKELSIEPATLHTMKSYSSIEFAYMHWPCLYTHAANSIYLDLVICSGHRTLCIVGLKTQMKLDWQKHHKKFGGLQEKHPNFTLLQKNMEPSLLLQPTGYVHVLLHKQPLFRIYFMSGTFYRGKNKLASWKPYNNA